MIPHLNRSKLADSSLRALRIVRQWRRWLPVGLASGLPQLVRGENQVDYRYENYKEDSGRMTINTHSAYFEQQLIDSVIAKGELTYDSISGATPTGAYGPGGQIALTQVEDVRRAISLEFDSKLANHTITPGFAYSNESDYESYGLSLNDAVEFNDKNTTLQFGVSHNFDSVREANKITWEGKQSTEGFVGISQLLTAKTILTGALTYGNDSGYLNDPYRVITYTLGGFAYPENRPSHRNKQIAYTSITQYFDSVNASLEGSYRFYHDSYGITAHTAALTWHQWLGTHVIAEPMFRFYEQSAADFYRLDVNNLYPGAPFGPNPTFYSSDYRLSKLYTLDFGLQATVIVDEHIRVIAGYHRYEMHGLDSTPSGAYPKANILTLGFSIVW